MANRRNCNDMLVRLERLRTKLNRDVSDDDPAVKHILSELISAVHILTQQTYDGIQGYGEWSK